MEKLFEDIYKESLESQNDESKNEEKSEDNNETNDKSENSGVDKNKKTEEIPKNEKTSNSSNDANTENQEATNTITTTTQNNVPVVNNKPGFIDKAKNVIKNIASNPTVQNVARTAVNVATNRLMYGNNAMNMGGMGMRYGMPNSFGMY